MATIPGFSDHRFSNGDVEIAYSQGGQGEPVLLLHGFPQSRAMWRSIAPTLAKRFMVIAPDLRGYGESAGPTGVDAMSFRNMAADPVALIRAMGYDRFHVVGHDRGARTAHRLCLDHPDAALSLTVMDIVPTHLLLNALTQEVAKDYYHWFFLAQPAPFPETLIGHNPDLYFERCLLGWGKATLDQFDPEALDMYRAHWRRPDVIHAMCNDYRAAIEVDFRHDTVDLDRRVACPSLVLFGSDGPMARRYDVAGTWSDRLLQMRAQAVAGGHFFPEQSPSESSAALMTFLSEVAD